MLFRALKPYYFWVRWRSTHPNLAQFSYLTTLENIFALYGREKKVVWASLFFPAEFIYAMDALPFYPEIAAGLSGALGMGDAILQKGEAHWFSADLCSYHRLSVGGSLWQFFPRPDALLATSSICRGTVPFFQTLAEIFRVPLYIVDVPREYSLSSFRYVATQLKEAQRLLGRKVHWDFETPFAWTEKSLSIAKEIETIRKKRETQLLPPTKNLDYLPYYYQFMGNKTALHFFQKLRDHLWSFSGEILPHRVLWLHLKPFYPNPLSSFLTAFGLGVVFEEFTTVYEGELNPRKPLESLAEKITITSYRFMDCEERINRVIRWCREYQAEGVIQFNQWGCRQSQGMNVLLQSKLRQQGIPLLFLDGDHLDRRHHSEEQWRTRLEAFAEMLR